MAGNGDLKREGRRFHKLKQEMTRKSKLITVYIIDGTHSVSSYILHSNLTFLEAVLELKL